MEMNLKEKNEQRAIQTQIEMYTYTVVCIVEDKTVKFPQDYCLFFGKFKTMR